MSLRASVEKISSQCWHGRAAGSSGHRLLCYLSLGGRFITLTQAGSFTVVKLQFNCKIVFDCSCFVTDSWNNFYKDWLINTVFLCAPALSLAWWVGMFPKCSGALEDNKDLLVGRTGSDSSLTHAAIFYSYLFKIGYFCLWVNVSITGFELGQNTVQWCCAHITNAGTTEQWLCITVQFYRRKNGLSTSTLPWVVKTNTLKSLDRKNWDWSSCSLPRSNVQDV